MMSNLAHIYAQVGKLAKTLNHIDLDPNEEVGGSVNWNADRLQLCLSQVVDQTSLPLEKTKRKSKSEHANSRNCIKCPQGACIFHPTSFLTNGVGRSPPKGVCRFWNRATSLRQHSTLQEHAARGLQTYAKSSAGRGTR